MSKTLNNGQQSTKPEQQTKNPEKDNIFVEHFQYLTVFTSNKCNLRRKPEDQSIINVDENIIADSNQVKKPEKGYFADQVKELLVKEGWKIKKPRIKKNDGQLNSSRRGSFEDVLSRIHTPTNKQQISAFSMRFGHNLLDEKSQFLRSALRKNTLYPAMPVEELARESSSPQNSKQEAQQRQFLDIPKIGSIDNTTLQKPSLSSIRRELSQPKNTQLPPQPKAIGKGNRGNSWRDSGIGSKIECFQLNDDLKRRCFIRTRNHNPASSFTLEKNVIFGLSQKDKLHPASFPVEISYKINKGLITKDRFGAFVNPYSQKLQESREKTKAEANKNNKSAFL